MSAAVRRVLWVWLLIVIVTALYWPTALSYSLLWTDLDNRGYTHGYLIAAMCLALIYMRRDELTGPMPRPAPGAYVALALLGLGWLLAYRAGIQSAHQLLFPIILWTAIYAVFGRRTARSCLFAVGFVYFALPIWGIINGALQALTIAATHLILLLIGLPVRFDGNLVAIPEGTFAIEGGCSGLHFMVVGLAIAAYYGELHRDTLRHRALLLGLAAALALLSNWIRVSVIIEAGHLTDMQSYLVRVSHYGFGWAVFAVAMTVFFLLASRLPAHPTQMPVDSAEAGMGAGSWPSGPALLLACSALALAPALSWVAMRGDAVAVAAALRPVHVPGWSGPLAPSSTWRPIFMGADRERFASYWHGASAVEWYTADYAFQRQGRKLLGYYNSILGKGGFTVLDQGLQADAAQRFVNLQLRDQEGAQSLVWYTYKIGEQTMTSGLRAQLGYGVTSLLGPVDSQIVAFRAKCEPDCAAAREQLRLFVASICDTTSRFYNCRRDP
jgi:EpsI family protein